MIVVPKAGQSFSEDDMKAFYDGKVAKWWIPDTVVTVDALPLGATGKILKNVLREKFGDALMGN